MALGPGTGLIVPEGVLLAVGMEGAHRVGQAEIEQLSERRARFGLAERVVGEGLGIVDVHLGRADIVVAAQHEHLLARQQLAGMAEQPLHPRELVGELLGGDGIAVGEIEPAHRQRPAWRVDTAFDIASRLVLDVAGQGARRHVEGMAREKRDAIEAFLPHDGALVAGRLDLERGERRLLRLDFLQHDDVRLGFAEPRDQVASALAHGVHVPGRDLH